MAADITCPSCKHGWLDYDLFDEADLEDAKADLEEKLETLQKSAAEMREFLKGIVDEFDKTPKVYSINRVLTKAEIQKMRRLVETTD